MFFTCPLTIPLNYFGGERVLWVRAGWTHCVAGTSSGAVYTWGRADYCQLGPAQSDDAAQVMLGADQSNKHNESTGESSRDKYR